MKISVVIPVYNVAPCLGACLDSVLKQSETDFECICVDDGSTDESGKILEEYACENPKVIVVHQQNAGLSSARNTGIEWALAKSDSEYLTFLDSDDYVHSDYLKELIAGSSLGCDVACVSCRRFYGDSCGGADECFLTHWRLEAPKEFWLKSEFPDSAWGKLYRKELFRGQRFPLGKVHEDEFVIYKVIFNAARVAYSDAKLYFYRMREGSTTKVWSKRRLAHLSALREQLEFFTKLGDAELIQKAKYTLLTSIQREMVELANFGGEEKLIGDLRQEMNELAKGMLLNVAQRLRLALAQNPSLMGMLRPLVSLKMRIKDSIL